MKCEKAVCRGESQTGDVNDNFFSRYRTIWGHGTQTSQLRLIAGRYEMHKKNKNAISGIVGGLLLFTVHPPMLVASGSFSNTGFGDPGQTDYDKGKKIFQEKVICESCPFSNMDLVDENIRAVLPELERSGQIGQSLSDSDRQSVKLFVKKRFNI